MIFACRRAVFVFWFGLSLLRPVLALYSPRFILALLSLSSILSFFAANVQNIPVQGICMSGIIAFSFVLLVYAALYIAFPQAIGSNAGWLF